MAFEQIRDQLIPDVRITDIQFTVFDPMIGEELFCRISDQAVSEIPWIGNVNNRPARCLVCNEITRVSVRCRTPVRVQHRQGGLVHQEIGVATPYRFIDFEMEPGRMLSQRLVAFVILKPIPLGASCHIVGKG